MLEPGLDKHLWESWWQQFDEDVQTAPAEALRELDDLIFQMLEARGYALDDPVAREGDDRDVFAEFSAAREITEAVEAGKDVEKEDVDRAIANYRDLYEFLIVVRGSPWSTGLCAVPARKSVLFPHTGERSSAVASTTRVVGESPHPGGGCSAERLGWTHGAG